jgi:hypothetical protein
MKIWKTHTLPLLMEVARATGMKKFDARASKDIFWSTGWNLLLPASIENLLVSEQASRQLTQVQSS